MSLGVGKQLPNLLPISTCLCFKTANILTDLLNYLQLSPCLRFVADAFGTNILDFLEDLLMLFLPGVKQQIYPRFTLRVRSLNSRFDCILELHVAQVLLYIVIRLSNAAHLLLMGVYWVQ